MNEIAIERFVEYLRIKTDHPNPDYGPAVKFLKAYADELGLPAKVVEVYNDKPVVVVTWKGKKHGRIGSILLNSHMDVVAVDEEKWTYPPFEARRVDGKIYARGAQDMKVVGVQYMEAIRRLKNAGFQPKRTVHLTFVPDEEIGSQFGMMEFVKTTDFSGLQVAFALDEGEPSATDQVPVYYGERLPWWLRVRCTGTPGHASMLKTDNAGEKFWRFTDKLMRFRDAQKDKFNWSYQKERLKGEDIFSANLTMVQGGKQSNVIPSELNATFDLRIPPAIDLEIFKNQLQKWCREAAIESGGRAESVFVEFDVKDACNASTDVTSPSVAPFWLAFRKSIESFGIRPKLSICHGFTDGRCIRRLGIPVIGFSSLPNTEDRLHDHDEHVNEAIFLRGIEIYEEIIKNITPI